MGYGGLSFSHLIVTVWQMHSPAFKSSLNFKNFKGISLNVFPLAEGAKGKCGKLSGLEGIMEMQGFH